MAADPVRRVTMSFHATQGRTLNRLRRAALVEVATSGGGPALDDLVGRSDVLLADAAMAHRLGEGLLNALDGRDLPGRTRLERWAASERVTRLKIGAALTRAASALDASGLSWVAVKGAVVGASVPACSPREYGDVDLLVAGRDFKAAIDVLTEAGVDEINRNWRGYLEHGCGEVPMVSRGVIIDLHWQLIGLRRDRRHFAIDVDGMLARRRRVLVGDLDVAALSAEDQLLHHALHAGLGGGNRLDQLRDLAALAAVGDVDWDSFGRLCEEMRVRRVVGHVIDRAWEVMGGRPPAMAGSDLAGGSLALRRIFDECSAPSIESGNAYPGLLVAHRRDRWRHTFVAFGTRLRERVAAALGRAPRWDAGDEGGPLYYRIDAGGEVVRREFMAYASRGR